MYDLIECSNNYLKPSGILWQYCRVEPTVTAAIGNIVYFNAVNANTNSFKIKENITGKTVLLKHYLIFGKLFKCLALIVKLICSDLA